MGPLQRFDAAHGRDEPRSAEMYRELRSLYVDLYQQQHYEPAYWLEAVRYSFRLLPAAASPEILTEARMIEDHYLYMKRWPS